MLTVLVLEIRRSFVICLRTSIDAPHPTLLHDVRLVLLVRRHTCPQRAYRSTKMTTSGTRSHPIDCYIPV